MATEKDDIAKQKPSKYQRLSQKYHYVKQKYLKFLPRSPIARLFKALYIPKRTFEILTIVDPHIRKALFFYRKNHSKLESNGTNERNLVYFLKFLKETELLDGDVLELGVYKGAMTTLFANFLKQINSKKKVYACDTFTGFPYDDKFSGHKNAKKGYLSDTSYEYVIKKFQEFEVDDKIVVIKGLFEEAVPQKLSDKKFSFILFDFDLYQSTMQALHFVYPRVPKNGIMIFQNYYYSANKNKPDWGETKAVDEFFADKGIEINKKPIPHFIKSKFVVSNGRYH